jgi:hypothetical protein
MLKGACYGYMWFKKAQMETQVSSLENGEKINLSFKIAMARILKLAP